MIIMIVFLVITFCVYASEAFKDSVDNIRAEEFAKNNNHLCYYKKKGKARIPVLTSTGEEVSIYNKNVCDRKGNFKFNIRELEKERRIAYCKGHCQSLGLDFYPYCDTWENRRREKHRGNPVLVSMKTGETFKLRHYSNGDADVVPVYLKDNIFYTYDSSKPGEFSVKRENVYHFDYDIKRKMCLLQDKSWEYCRITPGVIA